MNYKREKSNRCDKKENQGSDCSNVWIKVTQEKFTHDIQMAFK